MPATSINPRPKHRSSLAARALKKNTLLLCTLASALLLVSGSPAALVLPRPAIAPGTAPATGQYGGSAALAQAHSQAPSTAAPSQVLHTVLVDDLHTLDTALPAGAGGEVGGATVATATATVPVRLLPGMKLYENKEAGVSFQYPADWKANKATDASTLMSLSPANPVVVFTVSRITAPAGTSYPQAVEMIKSGITGQGSSFVDQGTTGATVEGATQATTLNYTGATSRGDQLRLSVVVAEYNGQMLLFSFAGLTQSFHDYSALMQSMTSSLSLKTPEIYGVPQNEGLFLEGGESSNPRDYDPASGGANSFVWSGLVSFDEQLHVTPELAQGWDLSPDGTLYTFHLRPNAHFQNGRAVTADDVIYSWERALSPKINSDEALTYLNDIVGAKEVREGKAAHISGLHKVDDHTLEVRIDAPKPYFLMKLTYGVSSIVDRQNVESGPDWYRHPNGTGPYKLTGWEAGKVEVFTRNDDFYLAPPSIKYVVLMLYEGYGLDLYETGDIDLTGVAGAELQRASDPTGTMHGELVNGVSMCTSYISLDVKQAPFDDPKVRQAFAMAIDKNEYLQVSSQGDGLVANGLYPPSLPGYNPQLQGLGFDPKQAKQLLAESRYGSAAKLPPIVFTTGGYGSYIPPGLAALADMWNKNLGVSVHIDNLDPEVFRDEIHAGRHGQLFDSGWCADYPDPENFADALFHTGATQNSGNYSNPKLDALLEKARVERDVAARMQLYQQAEQLIVADAPAIFLEHVLIHSLVKPYVHGFVFSPINIPRERHLSLSR